MDEGGGLENRYTGDCIVGSNPTPSAETGSLIQIQNAPLLAVPALNLMWNNSVLESHNVYYRLLQSTANLDLFVKTPRPPGAMGG